MKELILTREVYEKEEKKENEQKKESNLNPIFDEILNSFTIIYGPTCLKDN